MAKKKTTKTKAIFTPDASTRLLILVGTEEMLKAEQLRTLTSALTEAQGEIDTFHFDGKTATLADVLDELRGYSLMMTYKLVIVDQAEDYAKKFKEALERYAESPVDHATLVLRDMKWTSRPKLQKAAALHGGMVKCEEPKPHEAQSWIVSRTKDEYDTVIDKNAAALLIDRMGTNMMRLDTEVAKLSLMVEPGKPITMDIVANEVGQESDEQAWVVEEAILEAMAKRKPDVAIAKLHELIDLAGQADVLVGYFVAGLMRKLCVGQMMLAGGVSRAEVGKHLKLWGGRQQAFFKVLDQLKADRPRRLYALALKADQRSKSGFGQTMRNWEQFCVAMTHG